MIIIITEISEKRERKKFKVKKSKKIKKFLSHFIADYNLFQKYNKISSKNQKLCEEFITSFDLPKNYLHKPLLINDISHQKFTNFDEKTLKTFDEILKNKNKKKRKTVLELPPSKRHKKNQRLSS